MEKYYIVINDLQGGNFGMGRIYTIRGWKNQAIEWAESDENDLLIEELKKLPKDKIIDYISFTWEIEFKEITKKEIEDIENYLGITDNDNQNYKEQVICEYLKLKELYQNYEMGLHEDLIIYQGEYITVFK